MKKTIQFAENFEPSLKTGTYEIHIQPITDVNCQLASEMVEFTVSTERFNLPPNEVYSVYPPREAVGNYAHCLPHIVLNRRTLPWEQKLLSEYPTMPWVALLVFDETEAVQMTEGSCAAAIQQKEGVFVPNLHIQAHEKSDAACSYIHIPVPLLKSVLPYADALSLLAHAKGVSLDRKVTDSTVQDNWFATVISNRYSKEPLKEQSIRHTAFLVSLEGYEACLDTAEERERTLTGYEQARMIVLTSWSFSMSHASFDFNSIVSSLDAAVISTPYTGNQSYIKQLCQQGYYPMNHHIRDGSKAVSWYQPPLIPYNQERRHTTCRLFADQWLAYDPAIGMLDIRYASAWQLGKSMALADRAYAQQLYEWRQKNKQRVRTARYLELLSRHLTSQQSIPLAPEFSSKQSMPHENEETIQLPSADFSMLATSFLMAASSDKQPSNTKQGKKDILSQLNERYASILNTNDGGISDETMDE